MHKRLMDIEDVLVWAYREELPKARADRGEPLFAESSQWSPMFKALLVGRVGGSGGGGSFRPLDPHPDAFLVASAVAGLEAHEHHVYSGELGLLDGIGFGLDEAAAANRAQGRIREFVVANASMGRRPPFETSSTPSAVIAGNGKVQVLLDGVCDERTFGGGTVARPETRPCSATRGGTYPSGAYCPLMWDPAPQAVLDERAEYGVWWAALDLLADELAGTLATIAILPPAAAQRPWAGETDGGKPKSVVLGDRRPQPAMSRQQLEAQRKLAARRPIRRGEHGPVRQVFRRDVCQTAAAEC